MKRISTIVAGALAATLLAACGGGGGGSTGGGGGVVPPSGPTGPTTASVNVQVLIPGAPAPAAGDKRPAYVSPSTNGTTLTVKDHTSGTVVATSVADVSAGSPNCVGSAPRICTIPIVVPSGNYDFILKTYDLAPVSGAIPGTAKQLAIATLTQAITLNSTNTVNFALSGVVNAVSTGITYTSLPADAAAHTYGFAVSASDADGNVITGGNAYSTPITVTLTESGGSGHAHLVKNGTNVGASTTLASPTDTLSLAYDGGGLPGYTTSTAIGGATLRMSPLFLNPMSLTTAKLSDSQSSAITEASAPGTIAYSPSANCAATGATVTPTSPGSGASATLNLGLTSPPGTLSKSCLITVTDTLGTAVAETLNFNVTGPITYGPPTFGDSGVNGESGTCGTTVEFTGAAQTATIVVSDPGFAGTFTVGNTTPATATASSTGATLTLTAVAAGTTTVTLSDPAGNSTVCNIGVTTSGGSVN